MEQKRTGLSYVFTLARGERGKLGVGMLLAVLCSALSLIPYLVVYQILLLIIQNEVTFGAILVSERLFMPNLLIHLPISKYPSFIGH